MFVPYGNAAPTLPSIGTGRAPALRGPVGTALPPHPLSGPPRSAQSPDSPGARSAAPDPPPSASASPPGGGRRGHGSAQSSALGAAQCPRDPPGTVLGGTQRPGEAARARGIAERQTGRQTAATQTEGRTDGRRLPRDTCTERVGSQPHGSAAFPPRGPRCGAGEGGGGGGTATQPGAQHPKVGAPARAPRPSPTPGRVSAESGGCALQNNWGQSPGVGRHRERGPPGPPAHGTVVATDPLYRDSPHCDHIAATRSQDALQGPGGVPIPGTDGRGGPAAPSP